MSDLSNLIIRPYEPRDRQGVEYVCAQTAFESKPFRHLFAGDRLFAQAMTTYFLEEEPQGTQVVEGTRIIDGEEIKEIGGYCIGTIDGKLADQAFKPNLMRHKLRLALKLLRNLPGFTRKLYHALPILSSRQSAEGGTVHFNALPEYRSKKIDGKKIGQLLIDGYEQYLRENGGTCYFGHVSQQQRDPTKPVEGELGQRTNLRHSDRFYREKGGFNIQESLELPSFISKKGQRVWTTTITKKI